MSVFTLNVLFDSVIEYGYSVRKMSLLMPDSHDFGLDCWNILKSSLKSCISTIEKYDNPTEWNIQRIIDGEKINDINLIYNYVHDDLGMKGDETDKNDENDEKWQCMHFFLQLVRIMKNNPKFDIIRLCQIAYNIGQLKVCIENHEYNNDSLNFLYDNNMLKMEAYVKKTKQSYV